MRRDDNQAQKKLRVTRESLRTLTPDGLNAVKGGAEQFSQPYTALCGSNYSQPFTELCGGD